MSAQCSRVHGVFTLLFILKGEAFRGSCSLFTPLLRGEHEHPLSRNIEHDGGSEENGPRRDQRGAPQ